MDGWDVRDGWMAYAWAQAGSSSYRFLPSRLVTTTQGRHLLHWWDSAVCTQHARTWTLCTILAVVPSPEIRPCAMVRRRSLG